MFLGLQNEKSLKSSSSATDAVLFCETGADSGSNSGSDFTARFFTERLLTGFFAETGEDKVLAV